MNNDKRGMIKNQLKRDFTQIPNELITSNIPDKAFRIMVYLWSRPDNWIVNQKNIAKTLNISIDTVKKHMKVLKESGYITVEKVCQGYKNIHYKYELNITGNSGGKKHTVNTNSEGMNSEGINSEGINSLCDFITPHNNTNLNNTEYTNTEYTNTKATPVVDEKLSIIDNYFQNQEINVLFNEFLKNRKEVYGKKINTELSVKKLINKLNKFDDDAKKEMINNSIENGWKGLFEIKSTNRQSKVIGSTDNWYQDQHDNKSINNEELKRIKERQNKM